MEIVRKQIWKVENICELLDKLSPSTSYKSLITFVEDRPGHDKRYAINPKKIRTELGWAPRETFETGLQKTVHWYLNNKGWVRKLSNN